MKRSELFTGIVAALFGVFCAAAAAAEPATVTLAGSFQSEVGCAGDWDPACPATHLTYDESDGVWQAIFDIPAGSWEYKLAVNDSWNENYGANATRDGATISLILAEPAAVKFYYDHETHWITDNHNSIIAVAPGSFQSEMGAEGDWQPDCLRSWLQDPDGDGIFSFITDKLPPGDYEAKVAINESWSENYGVGGVQNGANYGFTVAGYGATKLFSYNSVTHVLTVADAPPFQQPAYVTVTGSFQSEVGCGGDWDPACPMTYLTYDESDGVWQGMFYVPAGSWEYKLAVNNSWDENYGANATPNGANISLNLSEPATVKFYYDHRTHWITSDHNSDIVVAPGNFQSELGAGGDWQPDSLRSWLQDPDGDGIFTFVAGTLPPGDYEAKVAINESWSTNYGVGGVLNGPNFAFSVPVYGLDVTFSYNGATHVMTIDVESGPNQPPTAVAGDDQSVRPGQTVYLDASGSYDDNTEPASLEYFWYFTSTPEGSTAVLAGHDTTTPSFVADLAGTYRITLAVIDSEDKFSWDEVVVSSSNLAPTAVATANASLVLVGQTVTFDGTASTDPESDPLSYQWTLVTAPTGSSAGLTGSDGATASLTPDLEGAYVVSLQVSDPFGPGTSASVEVTATTASGYAQQKMVEASATLADLPPVEVTTAGNQTALQNFLSQAAVALANGDVDGAIDKLQKALARTDGCAVRGAPDGNGPERDWITDCTAQGELYPLLVAALNALTGSP